MELDLRNMEEYNFSVWLPVTLPHTLQEIVQKYNPKPHQPHVTIQTNMNEVNARQMVKMMDQSYLVKADTKCMQYSSHMYAAMRPISENTFRMCDHDPLNRWHFPVDIQSTQGENPQMSHKPHITLCYFHGKTTELPQVPHIQFTAISNPVAVDTRSSRPWEWKVIP